MNISSFVICFCSISLVTILLDLILPDGRMLNIVKSFSMLLIFCCICASIVSLITNENEENIDFDIDESFVESVYQNRIDISTNLIEEKILDSFEVNSNVEIDWIMENNNQKINSVNVYLSGEGISKKDVNIDIKEQIAAMVSSYFQIDVLQVTVYE